jgi:hypothetical protein
MLLRANTSGLGTLPQFSTCKNRKEVFDICDAGLGIRDSFEYHQGHTCACIRNIDFFFPPERVKLTGLSRHLDRGRVTQGLKAWTCVTLPRSKCLGNSVTSINVTDTLARLERR